MARAGNSRNSFGDRGRKIHRPDFQGFRLGLSDTRWHLIRDFIHVSDLAEAHSRGLDHLTGGGESIALNLGTGHGTSVKEIVAAIELVSNRRLRIEYEPRREGDPPELVADNALAKPTLAWEPRSNLTSIVESAWKWHTRSIPRVKSKPNMGSATGVRTS